MKESEFKQFVIVFAFLGLFLSVFTYFGGYNDGREYSQCNFILEQEVSCFKGCQYYAGAVLNWSAYSSCLTSCGNKYVVEFDEAGNIKSCSYGD